MHSDAKNKVKVKSVCLSPEAAEVSRLKAAVQDRVLVSCHERTPLNILQLSHFLKQAFFDRLLKNLIRP